MQIEIFLLLKYHVFCGCISTLPKANIWPRFDVLIHYPRVIHDSYIHKPDVKCLKDQRLISELLFYCIKRSCFYLTTSGERVRAIMVLSFFFFEDFEITDMIVINMYTRLLDLCMLNDTLFSALVAIDSVNFPDCHLYLSRKIYYFLWVALTFVLILVVDLKSLC